MGCQGVGVGRFSVRQWGSTGSPRTEMNAGSGRRGANRIDRMGKIGISMQGLGIGKWVCMSAE